jgi:tagatose 6-phosphate kinase
MILSVCPNPSVDKFLHLDELKPGQVNRSQKEQAYPGGKGTHVALAVSELGFESKLAGFWGGPTGNWIKEECSSRGIECIGPNIKEWTRTCLTILTNQTPPETEILEKGPEVHPESLNLFFIETERAIQQVKAVAVSGSWPDKTPDDVWERLKFLTDNAKIPLWADASGQYLKQAIKIKPFGIHINRKEAYSLFGNEVSPATASKKLLNHCTISAVTDGSNGLFLSMGDETIHASYRIENVISTIGSGDCLLAGLITAHLSGESLSGIARMGTACGAANCIRKELGMLHKKDVDLIKPKVIIDKLHNTE